MHSDSTSIQLREAERQSLARAMEEYERSTKVETTPILVRDCAEPYNGRRTSKELSDARNKGRIKALAANKAANLAKKKGKALLREEW